MEMNGISVHSLSESLDIVSDVLGLLENRGSGSAFWGPGLPEAEAGP